VAAPGAEFVLLVKPQFESRKQDVGKGGVVRDAEVWRGAIVAVARACEAVGASPRAVMASPLPGPAGNIEFLLHAGGGMPDDVVLDIDVALEEGSMLR
jgi:23S rRNA (cytidine1920-2'-O)/16S rRNA (cytidine1409-2'-O)-methyltransferase